jgi:hypothetical protein
MSRSLARRLAALERRYPPFPPPEAASDLEAKSRPKARLHATAVAAITLFGQPNIDEPLEYAWNRALRRHRIKEQHYHEIYGEKAWRSRKLEFPIAAEMMYPIIIKGKQEAATFAKIFKTAPDWLLEFTQIWIDASLLNFKIRRLSHIQGCVSADATVTLHKEWHDWPLIPLGKAADAEYAAEDEGSAEDQQWRNRIIGTETRMIFFEIFDRPLERKKEGELP